MMDNELTIKIAGEAGQGMQTVGATLCKVSRSAGFYLFASQDYMSRIRGGNNFYQIRVSDKPLYTLRQSSDIMAALDNNSVGIHRETLSKGGVIILDKKRFNITEENDIFFDIPMYNIAKETGGR
ncbi:MAG: hypothetical protein E3K32_00790 [wastewater metagenome]|nr:hypothetical protein [Candidatus Loosdrechtia aerotolerans]